MDGFFLMTFTGAVGSGFGIIVLRNGTLVGADVGGATFDGTYSENPSTQTLTLQITMNAPAGMVPVQTGIPMASPTALSFNASVAKDDIGMERPTLIETPLGPVNVIFRKLRDFS